MKINRAYKTKLRPNRNQQAYFEQCGRVARQAYNWVLADYMADYQIWHAAFKQAKDAGLIPEKIQKSDWPGIQQACVDAGIVLPMKPQPSGRVARKKKLNAEKKVSPKLQFMASYPYVILESAVDDFDAAMKRYIDAKKTGLVERRIAERLSKRPDHYKRRLAKMLEKGRVGEQLDPYFPRFKRRDDDVSFTLRGAVKVESDRVKLPVIGWVKLAERGYIPNNPIKICDATIRHDGRDWFVSVTCVVDIEQPELHPVTLGVSVGVMDAAATSTGRVYENPRVLAQYERKKKRLNRELARRGHRNDDHSMNWGTKNDPVKNANWLKTKQKIDALDRKIANVRAHHQHNTSRWIADTHPERIVVKQMDIQGMMSDVPHPVAKSLADAGMGELTRQIAYKAEWTGAQVDSATGAIRCSQCGSENIKINYGTRMMTCGACGHTMRASVNIAINLSKIEVENA